MKILHIHVDGAVNKEQLDSIRTEVEQSLKKGYLITSGVVSAEVLDLDEETRVDEGDLITKSDGRKIAEKIHKYVTELEERDRQLERIFK